MYYAFEKMYNLIRSETICVFFLFPNGNRDMLVMISYVEVGDLIRFLVDSLSMEFNFFFFIHPTNHSIVPNIDLYINSKTIYILMCLEGKLSIQLATQISEGKVVDSSAPINVFQVVKHILL